MLSTPAFCPFLWVLLQWLCGTGAVMLRVRMPSEADGSSFSPCNCVKGENAIQSRSCADPPPPPLHVPPRPARGTVEALPIERAGQSGAEFALPSLPLYAPSGQPYASIGCPRRAAGAGLC